MSYGRTLIADAVSSKPSTARECGGNPRRSGSSGIKPNPPAAGFVGKKGSLHPVLLKQFLQGTCGIVGIERCPDRVQSAALQQINSLLLRQVRHHMSKGTELIFSMQVL
jgi:hypothetical protein